MPGRRTGRGLGQFSRLPYIIARFGPSGSVVQKEVGLRSAFTFRGASGSEQVNLSLHGAASLKN